MQYCHLHVIWYAFITNSNLSSADLWCLNFSVDDVSKLAVGLLALYQPELKKVKQQLDELTLVGLLMGMWHWHKYAGSKYTFTLCSSKKQTSLIDKLQDENRRFNNVQTSEELQQMVLIISVLICSHHSNEQSDSNPTAWFSTSQI